MQHINLTKLCHNFVVFGMSFDRVIVQALKLAHNLVCQNLRPAHLTEASIVLRLRELVHSPSVRLALERGSDTVPRD